MNKEKELKAFGERVRKQRVKMKLTQAALARRVGRTAADIERIESGLVNVKLVTLVRLARALDIPPSDLVS